MNILDKVNWEKGMEITAATFIEAERYHTYRQDLNRRLLILRSYGLVPGDQYELESRILDNTLEITRMHCEAVSRKASLFQLYVPLTFTLPECEEGVYYFMVYNEGSETYDRNEISYIRPHCSYGLKQRQELSGGDFFPLLKLVKSSSGWQKADYIPPSVSLSAHPGLSHYYLEIKRIVDAITAHLKEHNDKIEFLLSYTAIELHFFTGNEAPGELILLVKKIMKILQYNAPHFKEDMESYIAMPYDHDDCAENFEEAVKLLESYREIIMRIEVVPNPEPEPELPQEDFYNL